MRIAPNPKTLICKAGFALVCALLLPGAAPSCRQIPELRGITLAVGQGQGRQPEHVRQSLRGADVRSGSDRTGQLSAGYVKPIGEYIDRVVSDKRVATGKQMLIDNKALLDTLEPRYGVDATSSSPSGGSSPITARSPATRRYPVARHAHLLGNQGERRPAPAHNRAQDPPAWRYQRRGDERLVGRRYGPYPIHSDHLFGLCS